MCGVFSVARGDADALYGTEGCCSRSWGSREEGRRDEEETWSSYSIRSFIIAEFGGVSRSPYLIFGDNVGTILFALPPVRHDDFWT